MPATTLITTQQFSRLIGLPGAPAIVDVRIDEDYRADPRLIPGALRRDYRTVASWAPDYRGKGVVVVCQRGQKLSEGTAACLRHDGIEAQTLEGGFEGWKKAGEPLVRTDKLPPREDKGRTVWVTRSRPKVDRIACPWLIRRFIDPNAVFLFVLPTEVTAVAERFNATPFDIEGVFWSHRGETCTFDTMIEEFSLKTDPLLQLAKIVRGADTARPDLTPQSAGLRPGSNPWVDSLLGNQLPEHARPTVLRALQVSAVWLALWLVPVAALLWTLGSGNVFSENLSGAIG